MASQAEIGARRKAVSARPALAHRFSWRRKTNGGAPCALSPENRSRREVPVKTELRYALACAFVSAVAAVSVHATEGDAGSPAAQARMASCSQEAKGLKGEEREKFMAKCQKGGAAAKPVRSAALESQQNKMKKCNSEAGRKALKGDERRAFMSACLKG
jgi:hypothetical protein